MWNLWSQLTIQSIGSFETESTSDNSDDDDGDGNYLHPSLFASKKSSRLEEIMKVWLQTYPMLFKNINILFSDCDYVPCTLDNIFYTHVHNWHVIYPPAIHTVLICTQLTQLNRLLFLFSNSMDKCSNQSISSWIYSVAIFLGRTESEMKASDIKVFPFYIFVQIRIWSSHQMLISLISSSNILYV